MYDSGYWQVFRDVKHHARAQLGVSSRHLTEAEMKKRAQSPSDGIPAAALPAVSRREGGG
jgi:hypothetical protein